MTYTGGGDSVIYDNDRPTRPHGGELPDVYRMTPYEFEMTAEPVHGVLSFAQICSTNPSPVSPVILDRPSQTPGFRLLSAKWISFD